MGCALFHKDLFAIRIKCQRPGALKRGRHQETKMMCGKTLTRICVWHDRLTDPSVVAGVSAVVFDMMDGTPVVATVMAIVVFFLFRVASLPARTSQNLTELHRTSSNYSHQIYSILLLETTRIKHLRIYSHEIYPS